MGSSPVIVFCALHIFHNIGLFLCLAFCILCQLFLCLAYTIIQLSNEAQESEEMNMKESFVELENLLTKECEKYEKDCAA